MTTMAAESVMDSTTQSISLLKLLKVSRFSSAANKGYKSAINPLYPIMGIEKSLLIKEKISFSYKYHHLIFSLCQKRWRITSHIWRGLFYPNLNYKAHLALKRTQGLALI